MNKPFFDRKIQKHNLQKKYSVKITKKIKCASLKKRER